MQRHRLTGDRLILIQDGMSTIYGTKMNGNSLTMKSSITNTLTALGFHAVMEDQKVKGARKACMFQQRLASPGVDGVLSDKEA